MGLFGNFKSKPEPKPFTGTIENVILVNELVVPGEFSVRRVEVEGKPQIFEQRGPSRKPYPIYGPRDMYLVLLRDEGGRLRADLRYGSHHATPKIGERWRCYEDGRALLVSPAVNE